MWLGQDRKWIELYWVRARNRVMGWNQNKHVNELERKIQSNRAEHTLSRVQCNIIQMPLITAELIDSVSNVSYAFEYSHIENNMLCKIQPKMNTAKNEYSQKWIQKQQLNAVPRYETKTTSSLNRISSMTASLHLDQYAENRLKTTHIKSKWGTP